MSIRRFINQKQKLSSAKFTIEIHKSLFRPWMLDYSVKDFLRGGDIYENPQNYGDPQWASHIASNRYQTHPVSVERIKFYLQGYVYLRDGESGKMMVMHDEPVLDSGQVKEDAED